MPVRSQSCIVDTYIACRVRIRMIASNALAYYFILISS